MAHITEDFCRCGHVASQHAEGDGECRACKADRRTAWSVLARCHRFAWAETWELAPGAA